jgi:S-adenosylmethionine-diacylglycerol 3-amino-3-carboxypropyl transferase
MKSKTKTAYFSRLNYTLANEDTALELSLLAEGTGHVLAVAGSGGRVLPLLARRPGKLTIVDMVPEQLYLTELRIESVRSLSHAEFLAFWGYPPRPAQARERKAAFESFHLSPRARAFFTELFESLDWACLLYEGRWEKTFIRLSRINRRLVGTRGLGLFDCLALEEQARYLETAFPRRAWSTVLFLLGNAGLFNALLYKGHFPKKNIPESHFRFYSQVFEKLFRQRLARENFFLQLLFFGRVVYSEGCPVECNVDVFAQAKAAIGSAKIGYRQGDLIEIASGSEVPIDFLSLSDVPSYFTGALEKNFMQRVAPRLSQDALVVLRNYLHVPRELDLTGYETVTGRFREVIEAEKVGVYLIDIYRKRGESSS